MTPTPRDSETGARLAEDVRAAVETATWAPSVHNTQPWSFTRRGRRISLRADVDRRLDVADPDGREMLISCGAALLTLRVGALRLGYGPRVALLPDPDRPHLLADLELEPGATESEDNRRLHDGIRTRRTHRGAFKPDPVPEALLTLLRREAEREGARLRVIVDARTKAAVAALTETAEHLHQMTPAYAGELARWAPAPGNTGQEGVHSGAYPHEAPRAEPHFADRDYGRGRGWGERGIDWPEEPVAGVACILTTRDDEPGDWLRAGQALQRVLLRAAVEESVAAAFNTQALEIPELREFIRTRFCAGDHPQMIMRLGIASGGFTSVRRPVDRVLTDES